MELLELNMVEVRLIQSLWETKAPEYIANMLDVPLSVVTRKIAELKDVCGVKLYERPTYSTVQKAKEAQWAAKQLKEAAPMKIKDTTGYVTVRIDHKTHVQVPQPADGVINIDEVKRKYYANRAGNK